LVEELLICFLALLILDFGAWMVGLGFLVSIGIGLDAVIGLMFVGFLTKT